MKKTKANAFTLIELLVVVAIIALLIAILLPSLARARDRAKTSACLSNVRSLAQAACTYAAANSDTVVPAAYTGQGGTLTDLGFFALLVDGDLKNTTTVLPAGWFASQTVGRANYPTTPSFRSPFICPLTPAVDTTLNTTSDGFWQNSSLLFDNTLSPKVTINSTNDLFVQSSYGINGSNLLMGTNVNALPCEWNSPTNTPPFTPRKMATMPATSSLVFMYDGSSQSPMGTSSGDPREKYRVMGRHGSPSSSLSPDVTGQTNIAFFDGHAETVDRKLLPNQFNELYNNDAGLLKKQSGHGFPYWRIDEE